jgi:tetratricopeptide (TPR) repeat protein
VSVRATAAQLFELAAQLEQQGDSKRAVEILALLESDPNPDVRNEARYRQALKMEANGRNREAAVLLRRVLDEKPDAAAARLKLATMLQKMGDEGAALRELRSLRTIDLPPTVARFVDRLSASLQATKPLGFQVEVAVAPDTNINRATRSDTLGTVLGDFTLDEESKARSGIGAAIRGMAQGRKSLSEKLSFVARASGEARLYRDKEFNDISLDLSVGPEFQLGKTRFTAEAGVVQQWYGMEPYQRGFRLAGSATRSVGPTSQIRVDAGYRTVDNRLNDLQDGHGLSVRVRYERALSTSTLISTSVGLDRFNARDDAYSTRFIGGGITAYREMGRMTLSAGVEAGILKADERLILLPDAREDRLIRFQLGSIFRQFTVSGFAPMMRIVVERNKSTVEYYDYKRRRTELGVVRAF